MLRAVGRPVAVNPDGPLLKVAREEDWEILRFDRLGRRLKAVAAVGARGARRHRRAQRRPAQPRTLTAGRP